MPTAPHLPEPPRDRGLLAVLVVGAAGVLLVVAALVALTRSGDADAAVPAPPPVSVGAPAPVAGTVPAAAPAPTQDRSSLDERRFARNDRHHVRADWVAAFYPLYERAAAAFGVNWLLIASVHKQETGFSTHPTTYHGLNFAGCCAGPMQFNVTNGPVTTWDRMKDSFRRAERPASYNHRTSQHPSPYDDFDAIMAAAALLRDGGAREGLDGSAWLAAYAYYGHDLTGVDYASQVVARAIAWGRQGFRINGEVDPAIHAAVDAAWGAPVRAEYDRAAKRDG